MAPTPSGADDHSGAGDAAETTSHARPHLPVRFWRFLNETWRDYLWRGLKLAWRARWPFLVPMALFVVATVPSLFNWFSRCGLWWELRPAPEAPSRSPLLIAVEALRSAPQLTWQAINEIRLTLEPGEPAFLLVLCCFAAVCWYGGGTRGPVLRKPLVTGGLVAMFALGLWCALNWVPMFPAGFFKFAPLSQTVAAGYGIVAGATMTGLVGSLFWFAVQRERATIGRAFRHTASCLWPLLVFYFMLYAPGWVFWRWLSWTAFSLQVRVLQRAILPPVAWAVMARILWVWMRVAPLAGLPFPLLAVSTKGNARRTFKDLVQLYRQCWQRLALLLVLTALVLGGLTVAGYAITAPLRSWPSLTYVLSWYVFAVKALASIGGVMGMFLLIEDWRTGRKTNSLGDGRQGIG